MKTPTAAEIATLTATYAALRDTMRAELTAQHRALNPLDYATPPATEEQYAAARVAAGLLSFAETNALRDRTHAAADALGKALRVFARRHGFAMPAGSSDRDLARVHADSIAT